MSNRPFPTFQRGVKLVHKYRLPEVITHPDREALFAIALHGMGSKRV
jgi:hypothetical protein